MAIPRNHWIHSLKSFYSLIDILVTWDYDCAFLWIYSTIVTVKTDAIEKRLIGEMQQSRANLNHHLQDILSRLQFESFPSLSSKPSGSATRPEETDCYCCDCTRAFWLLHTNAGADKTQELIDICIRNRMSADIASINTTTGSNLLQFPLFFRQNSVGMFFINFGKFYTFVLYTFSDYIHSL